MNLYPKVLKTGLIERFCVFDVRLICEGFLVISAEGVGRIVPVLVDILWDRTSGDEHMRILVVAVVAGLKLALDGWPRTAMLACMVETVPQLHSSQTHLYYWFTSTR
jgi:hypothetical protein